MPPAPDPRLAVGRAIRAVRSERNLSQEALADIAGLHRTYIGGIERGERNPALLNLVRIAGALEVPLARLVEDVESPE